MGISEKNQIIARFFSRFGSAPTRALLLDYDGTLAPFTPDRLQAYPYPGTLPLLKSIAGDGTRVVVISGRPCEEVLSLLGLQPCPEVWGLHGRERRQPDGRRVIRPVDDSGKRALEKLHDWFAQSGLADCCEQKTASLALHWRGRPESVREAVRTQAQRAPDQERFRILPFDGGMEFCLPGADKGDAVRALLAELGETAAAAFLGDDLTDEDAFRAIKGRGLGVLVRPERRPTTADIWLKPPEELLAFLGAWHDHALAR